LAFYPIIKVDLACVFTGHLSAFRKRPLL